MFVTRHFLDARISATGTDWFYPFTIERKGNVAHHGAVLSANRPAKKAAAAAKRQKKEERLGRKAQKEQWLKKRGAKDASHRRSGSEQDEE